MTITDEEIKKLVRAGEIAKKVREEVERIAKPDMKLLELAEIIEKRIIELGGAPAFPVNLGVNEIAAHYTPTINDDTRIPDGAILKIDIGVHVEGYIADTATTITFNPAYEGLLEASRKALEKALENITPGIKANAIGKVIEETITSMGYKPIKNLSGHSIDRYQIHSGKSIPNYHDLFSRWSFTDGVYAIEPFATDGAGYVREGPIVTIYSLKETRLKGRITLQEKMLYQRVWDERKTLPFCERWYVNATRSIEGLRTILKLMYSHGLLIVYPVLIERAGGMVAQFEHTFIISGRDVIITTV